MSFIDIFRRSKRYLIVFSGDEECLHRAEDLLVMLSDDAFNLKPNVWLVESNTNILDWHEKLRYEIPELRFVCVELSGKWVSKGFEAVKDFLAFGKFGI